MILSMTKKIIGILLSCFLLLSFIGSISAQEEKKVNVYFFWSKTCPHCEEEKAFLNQLVQKKPFIEVKSFEVSNSDNIKLLQKTSKLLNVNIQSIPFTVISDQYLTGYVNDQTTGEQIVKLVENVHQNNSPDILNALVTSLPPSSESKITLPENINLPVLGELKTKNLSLPVLTIIIGVLDGFNPCAMWALVFLITLLLGMKDKTRMWILGTAFIVTSAFVYFLFMTAWLHLFLFLGFIVWIRLIISFIALGAGVYNLREYFVNKEAVCKVTASKKRQNVFAKLKTIAQKKDFLVALVGIILLAFAVNLVELICSAGLPAIYTQVLTLSNLPAWQYYSYLLLYIFFFMIDDLFVFFAAMKTLKIMGIESKYTRYSHLIGGLIMLIIGLLMIFKPELLMFG
ncbi:hypothetical protein ISS85_03555 [Candidatus Microgenomates bacterium]|nr:hypothetical protein [Candidatus Microgenomates bacterium]